MSRATQLRRYVADRIRSSPRTYDFFKQVVNQVGSVRHTANRWIPALIRPRPYKIMIAITAQCNSRCQGCRYGRDFMPGHQLEWPIIRDLLDDAKAAGFYSIRLYGGEPLLHKDLPRIVEHCVERGMRPYVTTNATLLDRHVDELIQAGLRDITVGFYGVGKAYDDYAQRPGYFERVERGIAAVRERHGDLVDMQMNWLLMRPTASVQAFRDARSFAERYGMSMRVDLIHYSLPYFQEGPDRCLQFTSDDRPVIEAVVGEIVATKQHSPLLLNHSLEGLRSIPDWLLLGPDMRVPCTAYEMIWVGPDGSVQLCYVTFPLGNLHDTRLRDLVFDKAHRCAARDAFQLKCPNCHCGSTDRVMRHGPSRRRYARTGAVPATRPAGSERQATASPDPR